MFDRSEQLRDFSAAKLPFWAPAFAAAITVSFLAGTLYFPSLVGKREATVAFFLNAAISVAGAAAGGALTRTTLTRRVAAAFGQGALGLVYYGGLVCIAAGAYIAPTVVAIGIGICVVVILVQVAWS